jgi:glyoxylase-like metal-dependent hydrolase (beta-lactamase superfamily II)
MSRRGAGSGFLAAALGLLASFFGAAAAPPRFQKLSEHYFYLAGTGGSGNVGALVTEDGVLLVDTPAEGDVAAALEALRRVTPKPVRWLVNTDLHPEHTGGNAYFLAHNALVAGRREPAAPAEPPGVRLAFDSQMRLFPGGIEARIIAVEPKAHTASDVVVFLPSEKVLHVGDLFTPGSYPAIDPKAGGSALGWLEATRAVIEAVPLLRSAMPPRPSTATKAPALPAQEKTLEELVVVVPGHGRASNLAELKNLLENAQKLRTEVGRAVSAGRSRATLLGSVVLSFREYKEVESFAGQLFDALSAK